MKQPDYLSSKLSFQHRKRMINNKNCKYLLINWIVFPIALQKQKQKQKQETIFNNNKITMVKKYMQQHNNPTNIFKQKHLQNPINFKDSYHNNNFKDNNNLFMEQKKQHRQIVMSQEFIKSSKLYRLLKQKINKSDLVFMKEVNSNNQTKEKLKNQIQIIKAENYQEKLQLWEIKNKLMQLKIMYHQQEEQNKKLQQENYQIYHNHHEQGQEEEMQGNGEQQENAEQQQGVEHHGGYDDQQEMQGGGNGEYYEQQGQVQMGDMPLKQNYYEQNVEIDEPQQQQQLQQSPGQQQINPEQPFSSNNFNMEHKNQFLQILRELIQQKELHSQQGQEEKRHFERFQNLDQMENQHNQSDQNIQMEIREEEDWN